MRGRFRGALLLAVAGLLGCEEGGSPLSPSVIGFSLTLTPQVDTIFATDSIQKGDTARLVARVKGPTGSGATEVTIVWTSSDPSKASVDATGLVQAEGFGDAVITADVSGIKKSARISVVQATKSVAVTPNAGIISVDDPVRPGDTLRLAAVSRDRNGAVVTGTRITWRSSAAGVAAVDTAGLVRALSLGTATITATGAGVSGTAAILVRTLVKGVTVTSPVTQALVSDTVQMSAAATDQADKAMAGRVFTWQSSNPAVATVSATGRVLLVGTGAAQITATTGFVSGSTQITVLARALTAVEVGTDFGCAVANLGRGYCWGVGELGQLGTAADSSCFGDPSVDPTGPLPCAISPLRFAPAVSFTVVSAGGSSACGIGTDSQVYCWGDDGAGQLGDGQKGTTVSGIVRATVGTIRFKALTVGGAHACAISTTDAAWCWGDDASGQLGDARRINSTTPIPLAVGFETVRWSHLSAGESHTCGVTTTGEAWCWGNNEVGQLGIGLVGVLASDVPVRVSGGSVYRDIAAGAGHTCAVTTTGGVECWGAASRGELGNGLAPLLPVYAPVAVSGLTGVSDVTSGGSHSCARTGSGAVSCWGLNDWGQVGSGTTGGQANAPAPVSGGLSFRSVSAGARHTCGLASDGNTYCWGSNAYGALGNELQAAMRGAPQKVATPR